MSGETCNKAILEAARVWKRSFDRGTRLADVAGSVAEDMPSDEGRFCGYDTPCRCYSQGYAAGRMELH